MTISVDCPHCESSYQLTPDMAGKSIRCPNPDCREIFTVTPTGPTPPTPEPQAGDDSRPYDRVESSPAAPLEREPSPRPARPVPIAARSPNAPPIPPGRPTPARPASGPQEIVWSGHDAPPPPPSPAPLPASPPAPPSQPADNLPFVRRKRKSPWPQRILIGFVGLLVTLAGAGGYGYLRYVARTEQRAWDEAWAVYQAKNYGTANKQFEELAKTYPDSTEIEKYRFFAALTGVQSAVGSVSARSEPDPALDRLRKFVDEFGNSTDAQPGSGYGTDIVSAGQQMATALADHADDRLKAAQAAARKPDADWQSHLTRQRSDPAAADLAAAESAVADGQALIPTLDRFRAKDGLNFDDQKAKFTDLTGRIAAERARNAAIAEWRDLPGDPTDQKIETFERAMQAAGLADDPEVGRLSTWAKAELRARVVGTAGFRAAEPPAVEVSPPVLFSAPVAGKPAPLAPSESPPGVVFAVAHGVLYALDSHDGKRLWGALVADASADPRGTDLPARVTLSDGRTDRVLVASTLAGRTGLTARDARTGEPVWHQPLEAGLAGQPLVLGRRVYVPLADDVGTVVEIQAATGDRLGQLTVRQRIGAALVGADGPTPGTHRLFVPADARRVFEFRVGGEAADGTPEPPTLTRDIPTGHPRDALTGTVLLVRAKDGSPRYLLMTLADGQSAMTVRTYALDQGDPPPTVDVPVAGWSSFPAGTDGERVVIATDAGSFAVIGVNQPGNDDRAIFPLPGPAPAPDQTDLKPSLVVDVNEDSAWVVSNKELVRLRTAVDPARGLRVVPHGPAVAVGDPVHRGQTDVERRLGVVVTRTADAVHATGFDLTSGAVQWVQQLGAVGTLLAAEVGPPLLIGETGGVFDAGSGAVLVPPEADPIGRAFAVADGPTVWALAAVSSPTGDRLIVREFTAGADAVKRVGETSLALPAPPAGSPVAAAGAVVLPLADGFLYRHVRGKSALDRGPRWRGTDAGPDATCLLASAGADRWLLTDGLRTISLRAWPTSGEPPTDPVAVWESRDAVTLGPTVLPGEAVRFAVADRAGGVSLFDEATPFDPVRRWLGSDGGAIPAGPPGVRLDAARIGDRTCLFYAVDRRTLVCLDADQPAPAWQAPDVPLPAGLELVGWAVRGDRIVTTDQTGRVTMLNAATGQTVADVPPAAGVDLAVGRAIPTGPGEGLLPALNGTVVRVPIPGR